MKTLETMASFKADCFKWAAQKKGTSPYAYMIQPLTGSRTTQIQQAGVSLLLRGSNEGLKMCENVLLVLSSRSLFGPRL